MGPLSPTCREAGAIPHAMSQTDCPRQVAGQDTKHWSPGDLSHHWHQSLSAVSPTSLDRTMADMSSAWKITGCRSKCSRYSQLEQGTRSHGGQRKRYKDVLKSNLKACNINQHDLESSVQDRSSWRTLCKTSVLQFESDRVNKLQEKRSQRKAGVRPTTGGFTCVTCGRICTSRIGLFSHHRTHPWRDPSYRRLSPSWSVTGHFACWTVRLLDILPTAWTVRLQLAHFAYKSARIKSDV